jgi:hypothetical protein
MIEPAMQWIRALNDPLRNPKLAGRWIAQLTPADPMGSQKEALELVANFPGARKEAGPNQVDALLRVDARMESVITHFTQQYCENYQKSSSVESRLWHAAFDLIKAFIAAYQNALKAGYPRAEQKRWRAILPWVVVRLAHYKGLDAKYRLFRYSHWIPGQWREYHELAEYARMRGWQREQLVLGGSGFAKSSVSFEQEYVKTLMLCRLDSGNFTPDQVEWVSRQLEDWAPSLTLHSTGSDSAGFCVDYSGMQGLRRRDRRQPGGRLQYLDTGPVYTRVVEQMRWLPDQDDDAPAKPGELPAREQKLLLMRLAALFGPEALAQAPRASRVRIDGDVRVVVGLQALTRAVAEIERLPAEARTPGVAASYDEVTQMVAPQANPESVARRIRGAMWKVADRSETGCRLIAPVREAPARLGELIGIRDGDEWALGVVRRMQRQQVDEVTVGAEIIARRLVRVLMRSWSPPTSVGVTATGDRPFFGIYLPAHVDNRQATQRSLVGPEERFTHGGMVELDTGNARYLIRFTEIIERQGGWAWGLFSAVRKLTS